MVRRMPSIRTSVRSSYKARSTASTLGFATRAPTARCTVAGSVACSATMSSATVSGVSARAPGARWCRWASRARRSAVLTRRMPEA
jgi:hypothetical protein